MSWYESQEHMDAEMSASAEFEAQRAKEILEINENKNKYVMWKLWSIEICVDYASDNELAQLEKKIQDFIYSMNEFQYFEYISDIINWNITYRLRSVNNN